MSRFNDRTLVSCLSAIFLFVLCGCGGGGSSSSFPTGSIQLSVQAAGAGVGTVSSNPAGINCGQACTASFSSGTQVTLNASPAANSFFAGWSGACSGTSVCKVTLTQNTSVMASFSASPVLAVTLSGTGKGSVASNPSGISCGTTCSADFAPNTQVTLIATAAANSSFAGWTGGCSGTNPTCTVTLNASQQVTANFSTANSPTLSVIHAGTGTGTVTSNPAGINCGSTCNASFTAGTQVTLTATAAANSLFAGWTGGGCSGTASTCTVTLNSNQQVTATFTAQAPIGLTVTLAGTGAGTVTSNPAGISCQPTCSANFPANSEVTLTATAAAGSIFAGWGGACSGANSTCQLTLASATSVTATFNTPMLTVTLAGNGTGTVTSNPGGISCQPTCSATFPLNSQVQLTAAAAAGSYFAGWTGACSGTNSTCTVTMTANPQVGATFTQAQGLNLLNHIVFLAQENRSFDHYFGALREYWAQNGYPDQPIDGLPQFNPGGQPPSIPGCNPADPPPDRLRV